MDDDFGNFDENSLNDGAAAGGGLAEHDPYNAIRDSERQGMRPGFLGGEGGGDKPGGLQDGGSKKTENGEMGLGGRQENARKGLSSAEDGALGGGLYRSGNGQGGAMGGRLFTGGKKKGSKLGLGGGGMKGKMLKISAAAFVVFGLVLAGIAMVVISSPLMLIGTIDFNLQYNLGYTDTGAILEEQSEYVFVEMLEKCEVEQGLADSLKDYGVLVGKGSAGDFEETTECSGDEQLSVKFDNQVISADEFVDKVESWPEFYAAYSGGVAIEAKYYYSDSDETSADGSTDKVGVNAVYQDMGLSRNNFDSWERTDDLEEDQKKFDEIVDKMLDDDMSLTTVDYELDCDYERETNWDENGEATRKEGRDGDCVLPKNIEKNEGAYYVLSGIAGNTTMQTGSEATERAAQLLNIAVSASEPYRAARAFMAIEEPIQRARIDGDGPVNELMKTLQTRTKVTYTDVISGEEVVEEKSILDTKNFAAAVANGTYYKDEAANFSRDRVLIATKVATPDSAARADVGGGAQANVNVINLISGSDIDLKLDEGHAPKDKSDSLVEIDVDAENHPDDNFYSEPNKSSVDVAISQKNSEQDRSTIGGNRIVEGCSFLSNTINTRVLGAAPSDEATVLAYNREVETVLARRAEADRATKSPFDISSPNTFLGSIVRSFAESILASSALSSSGSGSLMSGIKTVASVTGKSATGLFGVASAEGENEEKFTTTMGENCNTVKGVVGAEGDIYCTAHHTVWVDEDREKMKYTIEEWAKQEIGVSADRTIGEGAMSEYIDYGMDRRVTAGVRSVDICRDWNAEHPLSLWEWVWTRIAGLFSWVVGEPEHSICDRKANKIPTDVATGVKYSLTEKNSSNLENIKKTSAYALYDTTWALMSGKQSGVAKYREERDKDKPVDNSTAGWIARISGMSKEDAELALSYASYLNMLAKYNPAERYAFGAPAVKMERRLYFDNENVLGGEVVLMGAIAYADVRNRTVTV